MDIKEIRAKNDNELLKDLAAMQEQVRELRFKSGSQEVKNVNVIAGVRRDIARIKTILTERVNNGGDDKAASKAVKA